MDDAKKLELAIELAKLEVLGQIRDHLAQSSGRPFPQVVRPATADERVRKAFKRIDALTKTAPAAPEPEQQ